MMTEVFQCLYDCVKTVTKPFLRSSILQLTIASLFIFRFYKKKQIAICSCKKKLYGKTAIVTGASNGIGLETALELATRGARVIMADVDTTKAHKEKKRLVLSTGNAEIVVKYLDLSSLECIRRFCNDIIQSEKRLDILVNNAGIAYQAKRMLTLDSLELIIGINYFGHFLLTNLLLKLLIKSSPSRVVNVSSFMYRFTSMDFQNLNSEKNFDSTVSYSRSKLALILFSRALSERLKNTGVTVNCTNTGVTRTGIAGNLPIVTKLLLRIAMFINGRTANEAAQVNLHVAISKEGGEKSGKYFVNCKEEELRNHAINKDVAKDLWSVSEKLTRLSEEERLCLSNLKLT